MAWQFILLGVQTDSLSTTWASTAELATPSTAGLDDLVWGPSGYASHPGTDWAGLGRSPVPIGEILNAHSRQVSLPINGLATAAFQVDLQNPITEEITSREDRVLLKVYEDGELRFIGDCVSTEEVGGADGVTLQANFASPLWRLQHRLVRKLGPTGYTAAQPDVAWVSAQPGAIITEMVENANAVPLDVVGAADTGIRMGTVDTLTGVTVGLEPPWNYKTISEALLEMQAAGGPGAFDFELVPVEPVTDSIGMQIATMNVRSQIGTDRTASVVFEYGDGSRSASSYSFKRDRNALLNRAYMFGEDTADDTQTVTGSNLTSQTNNSLHEGVVSADLGDDSFRQAFADANVALRGEGLLRAEFKPAPSAQPQFGMNPTTDGDYTLGDTVRVRVKVAGVERRDIEMRVYAVDIALDDEGKEEITPRLVVE